MAGDEDVTVKARFILFAQLNDLYHIDTSADYLDPQALILPRIATFLNVLRAWCADSNGHFRFCVPGDFLAPSCLSKEFHGKHMVEILNAMGVNLVSFGNHEFEPCIVDGGHLKQRIRQSNFKWLNLNIRFRDQELSAGLDGSLSVVEAINLLPSHTVLLFGVMNADLPESVGWLDSRIQTTKAVLEVLREHRKELMQAQPGRDWHCSTVVMTHQDLRGDIELARRVPGLSLIMGGHDHNVLTVHRRKKCLIVKAASNARTLRLNWVAVVPRAQPNGDSLPRRALESARFAAFAKSTCKALVISTLRDALLHHAGVTPESQRALAEVLVGIDSPLIHAREAGNDIVLTMSVVLDTESLAFMQLVPMDHAIADLIDRWNGKSRHSGEALCRLPVELVIRDRELRRQSTNFGNLMADIVKGHVALSGSSPPWQANVGLVNAGSMRIDRNLQAGEAITPRTVRSILGHPNKIKLYEVSGQDLLGILGVALRRHAASRADEGDGQFLQLSGLQVSARQSRLEDVHLTGLLGGRRALKTEETYSVATTGYVAEAGKSPYATLFNRPAIRTLAEEIDLHLEDVLRSTDPMQLALALDDSPRWRFA